MEQDVEKAFRGALEAGLISSSEDSITLTHLGVTPGAEIVLHQKKPAFVIRVGETDIAIDDEIAKHIYVRKVLK